MVHIKKIFEKKVLSLLPTKKRERVMSFLLLSASLPCEDSARSHRSVTQKTSSEPDRTGSLISDF